MSHQPATDDLDTVIDRYAAEAFDDETSLIEAGLVSLSIFRIITDVVIDDDVEIDASRLADVRTIGDLKNWLRELTGELTGGAPIAAGDAR